MGGRLMPCIGPFCDPVTSVTNAISDWLNSIAQSVIEAVGQYAMALGASWVAVPTPRVASSTGTPSDAVAFIQSHLIWYVGALAVLSVIIGGARMAWERRAEPGRELLKSLLTLVVVSGAGLAVVGLATTAADRFSVWIIVNSAGCDGQELTEQCFGRNVTTMLGMASTSGLGIMVVLVGAFIAMIATVLQIIMMLIRGGMLVILAGVFPLTAAFTNTEAGRGWFKKCVGWLIAFILYKPAAAIIYATAFRLTGSGATGAGLFGIADGILKVLTGVTLMCMALIALPALMRFVTPMVAATAGGAGAGMIAAGAVAAGATGAMSVATKMMKSSSGDGGGSGGKEKSTPGASPNASGKTSGSSSTPGAGTGGGGAASGAKAGGTAGGGAAAGAAATGGASLAVMAAAEGAKKVGEGIKKAADSASDATGDSGGGPSGSGK